MIISKLPKNLRELALKRQKENPYIVYSNDLINAFDWEKTPEGFDFWEEINETNFELENEKKETEHEKLMRRLNKAVELHEKAQDYELSERRVKLCTYLYEKRNKYLRELIYTQIQHSEKELPFK